MFGVFYAHITNIFNKWYVSIWCTLFIRFFHVHCCNHVTHFYSKPHFFFFQQRIGFNVNIKFYVICLSIHMMHLTLFPCSSNSKALLMSLNSISCEMKPSRFNSCSTEPHIFMKPKERERPYLLTMTDLLNFPDIKKQQKKLLKFYISFKKSYHNYLIQIFLNEQRNVCLGFNSSKICSHHTPSSAQLMWLNTSWWSILFNSYQYCFTPTLLQRKSENLSDHLWIYSLA